MNSSTDNVPALKAEIERLRNAIIDTWQSGDVQTLNNHVHASVLRAALDGTDKPTCTTCSPTRPGFTWNPDDGTGSGAGCWVPCPDCSPAVPEDQP